MYNTIDDICNSCLHRELPVVFFDSCSILDIVNSLHSNSLPENYALSAFELIKLHKTSIWLITSQNVCEEWKDNIDNVLSTMDKEILKVDRNISSMTSLSNLLLNTSYQFPNISSLKITKHVRALSERFLNTCLHIERKVEHTLRAMQRVRKNEAPARKGKPEPKDCEIIECFLDTCKSLKSKGFKGRFLFFTANKDDFGSNKKLKPPLDRQFSEIGAELINSIDHVLAIAKGQEHKQVHLHVTSVGSA